MQIIKLNKEDDGLQHVTPRLITGLWSFDWAFIDNLGNAGLPLRSIIEIVGNEGVGKSTVMFSLAGRVADKLSSDLYLLDLERQNPATIESCLQSSGFSGKVEWDSHVVKFVPNDEGKKKAAPNKSKKPERTPESLLDGMVYLMGNKKPPVIMIDSLAAWDTSAAFEGSSADADMGIRAKVLRKWFKQSLRPLNSNPNPPVLFFTNHLTQIVGAMKPGPNAPIPTQATGGTAVGYFSTQVIHLSRLYGYSFPSYHGWVLEGKLRKNRDGYGLESKQVFYLYIQAGEGVNANMTSVIDCVMYGLAESSAKGITETGTITMDEIEYKVSDLIANRHDDGMFAPFHNALKSQTGGIKEQSSTIGE